MGKQNKKKQKATNAAEGCLSDDDLENMEEALKRTAGCSDKKKKNQTHQTVALKKNNSSCSEEEEAFFTPEE